MRSWGESKKGEGGERGVEGGVEGGLEGEGETGEGTLLRECAQRVRS